METEADAVCRFVRREIFPSRVALSVDVHSGYGTMDRFWFPYARTRHPFPNLPEAFGVKRSARSHLPQSCLPLRAPGAAIHDAWGSVGFSLR